MPRLGPSPLAAVAPPSPALSAASISIGLSNGSGLMSTPRHAKSPQTQEAAEVSMQKLLDQGTELARRLIAEKGHDGLFARLNHGHIPAHALPSPQRVSPNPLCVLSVIEM